MLFFHRKYYEFLIYVCDTRIYCLDLFFCKEKRLAKISANTHSSTIGFSKQNMFSGLIHISMNENYIMHVWMIIFTRIWNRGRFDECR